MNKENIIVFILGFISFSLLTSIVYLTNDYLDFKIDKNNKLKKYKYKNFFSKNSLILINFFFIPYFFILDFYNLFSFYLIIYLLLFYFYTFFGKIKYLDLVLLNSFYILRLLYGCDLFDLIISYWFIIFFQLYF